MAIVSPSILSANFGDLANEVRDVISKGADLVHVDVMDGRFVPNLTFGPPVIRYVKEAAGDVPLDVHLMIVEPEKYLEDYRDAGADWITVHAEASPHLHRTLQAIRGLGCKSAVALNPGTSVEFLDHVLDLTDLVLVMSVNPGFGGQSLIDSSFRKIEQIRKRIDQRGLATLIEVDGGVKPHNAHKFTEAGAHALVSGSGVFGADDRAAAIAALKEA